MKKIALIFGINGMDGSHLADLLLEKNYEIFGVENTLNNRINSSHFQNQITFTHGDINDKNYIKNIINDIQPHEIYNLAAQSRVEDSWNSSELIGNTLGIGPLRILESIRETNNKNIRFFQALSSEMFGRSVDNPTKETSPFYPKTPYGAAKLYAYWMCKNYREIYGMHNSTGILFNHESERRKIEFLSRKVTSGVAKIHLGLEDKLSLGSLEGYRDWSYAPDFVEAIWLMLQQEESDDYILCSGQLHSIKDLINESFKVVGITDWDKYIIKDNKFFRPTETEYIVGDNTKAKEKLGWVPKTTFTEMINKMVTNDIKLLKTN